MTLWRDPLDELLEELEAALPATEASRRDEHLPRLEDLQAVISPILFATKEQQERIFADPEYQRLSDTVMRQLAGIRDNPAESQVGATAPRAVNGRKPSVSADIPPTSNGVCICGAAEDAEHPPDCPFASETSR